MGSDPPVRLTGAVRPERCTSCMAKSTWTAGPGASRPAAIAHGSALLGLYFAVKAWSYALDRCLLMYDDNGVVVGAGYADIHVELPMLWLLVCLAAAAAVVALANLRRRVYTLDRRSSDPGLRRLVRLGAELPVAWAQVRIAFTCSRDELPAALDASFIKRNIALAPGSIQSSAPQYGEPVAPRQQIGRSIA